MLFSELCSLVHDYQSALYAPHLTGVHFGCDCGCGGDTYSESQWDEEVEEAKAAIRAAKNFCLKYNFYYDGV